VQRIPHVRRAAAVAVGDRLGVAEAVVGEADRRRGGPAVVGLGWGDGEELAEAVVGELGAVLGGGHGLVVVAVAGFAQRARVGDGAGRAAVHHGGAVVRVLAAVVDGGDGGAGAGGAGHV